MTDIVQEWRRFDLAGLQAELDAAAAQVAARQDESEQSRRALVDLTREFRKQTADGTRRQVAPLLKSFQAAVDRLSNRSLAAETAFLSAYKKLLDMPDVTPTLEYAHMAQSKLARLAELQMENVQLKETVSNLGSELSGVAGQEATIRQLTEQLQHAEAGRDTTVEERVRELEAELVRQFQEREQTYHDQQLVQGRRLSEAESKVAQLTSELALSQTELFQVKTKLETGVHAQSDELDMVLVDLERANQRAAVAERDAAALKQQLALAAQSAVAVDAEAEAAARAAVECQLAAKDAEISQLVVDVQRLQTQLTQLQERTNSQQRHLQQQVEEANATIQQLEATIEQQNDYDELKKEFSMLKAIEFAGTLPSTDTESADDAKPLHVLMLEKNKAMQSENTTLKVRLTELQARLESLERDADHQQRTIEEQRRLVLKLEEDLGAMNSLAELCRGQADGQVSSSQLVAEAIRDTMETPPGADVPAAAGPGDFGASWPATSRDAAATPDAVLLPIVSAQRERFRARIEQLEQQQQLMQGQLTVRESQVDELRADNVKLFEKIKFLQSYSAQRPSSVDVESRYSSQYEAHLDPFSTFSRSERHRKYAQLGPFDKISLSMSRLVLSSRTARTAVCLYTLLLHLLVFGVLYKMAHSDMYVRQLSSDCAERYAEHMLKIHGEHSHI